MQFVTRYIRRLIHLWAVLVFVFGAATVAKAGDPFNQVWMRGWIGRFGGEYKSALSPDGKLLAHHSQGMVRIHRLADGMMIDSIQTESWLGSLAWSADGKHLYFGAANEIWRFTLENRDYRLFFRAEELSEVLALGVSPDNTRIAAVGRVNGIESYFILPLNGSTPSGPFLMPNLEINKLYWLPDHQRIVVNGPNVFNMAGVRTVTNPSTNQSFSVSPDGSNAVQIVNRTVRANRLTDNAQLWTANLPSSVYNEWIEYFNNGSAIALADRDPEDRMAVQVFAPGAGFLARVRVRCVERAWAEGFYVAPNQRKIVMPFASRDNGWSRIEQFETNADLSAATFVSASSPRFEDHTRLQPTTIAPGTANARPGIAYNVVDEIPKVNLLEQSDGVLAASFGRLNAANNSRNAISTDGRFIAHIGKRETGAFGYHVYRTSDNQRVGSFEGGEMSDQVFIGNNAVFAINNNWKVQLFVTNTSTGIITKSYEFPTDWDDFQLSQDGTRVAHQDGASNELWVSNTANGARVSRFTTSATGEIRDFRFVTPTRLFTLEYNGDQLVGAVWDVSVANAVQVCRVQVPRPFRTDNTFGAVGPDLKYLALAQGYAKGVWEDKIERVYGKIQIFRVSDGMLVATWDDATVGDYYRDLAYSTDSSTLFVSQGEGSVSGLRMPSGMAKVVAAPNPVIGGNNSTGTVTLSGPANAATTVTLASNSDRAVVPANVTIAAGQSSATFTITTRGVNANTTARITATAGSSVFTDLLITPPTAMTVAVAPTAVSAGASATGTVTVNGKAGPSGIVVALTSSAPAVGTVTPASVTIASGASNATFTFKAAASPTGTTTTVTAKSTTPALTASANVTVSSANLVLTTAPTTLRGGNATLLTVTLPSPAPAGGRVVKLVSDNAAVIVPAQIVIPAGQTTKAFGVKTIAVTATRTVNITATSSGLTERKVAVTVTPPAVKSIETPLTSVVGGTVMTLTIILDGPTPNPFTLTGATSDVSAATFPATINVPANYVRYEVTLTTKPVTTAKTVTLTIGGKTVVVSIFPAP